MSQSHIGRFIHTEEHKKELSLIMMGNKRADKFGETILTPEYKRQWCKEYYKKNIRKMREKGRIGGHNRRTAGERLTTKILQMIYEDNIKKYGTLTCYLCLKPILFGNDSIEHKTPLSRGGTNEYFNLAIAHLSCNQKKHTKTETEYKGGNNVTFN